MIDTLVVFGASGDLTRRLLLPAFAELGPGLRFIGSGEQVWTTDEFRVHVGHDFPEYRRADVTVPAEVAAVLAGLGPVVVYLALPTRLMLGAVRAIRACGLPPGSRVAVEKPFGEDEAGAVTLNAALNGVDAYRVDHLLAMTAVQDLPRVDGREVERIELLFDETLALEGRASFYDRAGALRDVMQNHLAQLLCVLVAPDDRTSVLRSVRWTGASRRARYTAGTLADGRAVPDYTAEDGVDPARQTETFAEVSVELDLPAWTGVPVVLRAGKALDARRRGVLLRYRSGESSWHDLDDSRGDHAAAEPAAYRRLLAELLGGGSSFAVSAEEAEVAWRVFTPVLDAWVADAVPLTTYAAGSAGP